MKKYLAILLCIGGINSVFAAENRYSIIVDAGSTGSRLHILQYDKNSKLPAIQDILSVKTGPGIATFADEPEKAGPALKELFDKANERLVSLGVDPREVDVSLMATAGMRLVQPEEKQAKIYASIRNFLTTHYQFPIYQIGTISGQMEGVYGWLDINYLANTFRTHEPTLGSIDMGGASTQIVFQTNDASHPKDEIEITIDGERYRVFSKSFLALGLNVARDKMNEESQATKCYTNDFPFPAGKGEFNFGVCHSLYHNIIENNHVTDQLIPIDPAQKFIGYSGAFYSYRIFDVLQTADQAAIEKRITDYCGTKNWEWWKATFPKESANNLPNYCPFGVYMTDLFYNTYGIKADKLTVTDNVNQKEIDWTTGALLYKLVN